MHTVSKTVPYLPIGEDRTVERFASGSPWEPSWASPETQKEAALAAQGYEASDAVARDAVDYVGSNYAAAFGAVKYLSINLWDRTDLTRSTKYYTHIDWKWERRDQPFKKLDLYLNFVSLKSWRRARQEQDGRWTKWYADRQAAFKKIKGGTRAPLIGHLMSKPAVSDAAKRLWRIPDEKLTKRQRDAVHNASGKWEKWPGTTGILSWDDYDNPTMTLWFEKCRWEFNLIDSKIAADWEPNARQAKKGHRPADFIGYWHQPEAQDRFLSEAIKIRKEIKQEQKNKENNQDVRQEVH
jgi:hypothetical protein